MFFMGQEYGATTPFTYFTDFQDRDLAKAVSEGRKKEYAGFLDEGFIDPQVARSVRHFEAGLAASWRSRSIRRC